MTRGERTSRDARLTPGPRGCRLFVDRTDDLPLVWLRVVMRGGLAGDPEGVDGLTHHVATLARRGAGARDRVQLDRAIDQLGGSLEPHTGRDAVSLAGVCLSRYAGDLAALAADVLASPRMEPGEHHKLIRETAHQLDELRDDDGDLAARWFDHFCAPGHPYARSPLGHAASLAAIERMTPAELLRAHERAVAPGELLIGFAGDIDHARAEALAGALVAALPDTPPRALPELPDPVAVAARPARRLVVVDKPERTQCQVLIGHPGPRYGTEEHLALSVVTAAFGGMFTSRLMQEIRVRRGWSYGAGCGLSHSRGAHWFAIQLAPGADVAADAVALVLEMFSDVAARGIDADELELATSYLAGSLPFDTATARQRIQLALLDAVCGLPPDYHAGVPARLAEVTLEAANAAASAWLRPRDALVVVVATADELAEELSRAVGGSVEVVAYDAL